MGQINKKRCTAIPFHVVPGRYQLKWSGIYEVNAVRSIPRTINSDYFIITDKPLTGKQGIQGERGLTGKEGKVGKGKNIVIFGKQVNK